VSDVVKEGDMIEVKVLDINDRGQIKLSRKALLPPPQRDQREETSARHH
jgi:polyribonucleotide nucleotidyltransferase